MNILLVDDDALQRDMLRGFLVKQGHTVDCAANGGEAERLFMARPIEVLLLDHRMPGMNGDELLARLKAINPLVRAIMITAYGAVDTAVKVMRLGADDFLEKPLDLQVLLAKLRELEDKVVVEGEALRVNESLRVQDLPIKLVGDSPAMHRLLSQILRVAPTPWTVLLRGETGTGKEMISRLIHLLSPRGQHAFIEVNCAAVPENLFESELFGHEKGSFTGADGRRRGMFELAAGGTLFLDEVGELPLALQAKLLRALQEKTITRVGGEKGIAVDARIVAASNRDLKAMVDEGRFREDLYFRLHVIELELPPLRRRKEDIPPLVTLFLERYGRPGMQLDGEAMAQLAKYHFPGNVRELEHAIQRMTTFARGQRLGLADLPAEMRHSRGEEGGGGPLGDRLAELERTMILESLRRHDWVQTRAAEELGISERVLRYKMEKQDIRRKDP